VRDRAAGRFCAGILGSRCTVFVIGGDWCWGLLVGFPFMCHELAMARLPLAGFGMMLALLPATATLIGTMVLDQMPSACNLIGIAFVMGGVSLHRAVARG
ncbi:MAG: hypothetical protein VYD85_08295, partial [Pseudomonadota bacterium]|nr:hypothetical protein [Pseudomonadota bacterium]